MRKKENKDQKGKRRSFGSGLYAFVVLSLALAIVVLSFVLLFHTQKIEVKGNEYTTSLQTVNYVKNEEKFLNTLYLWGKYRFNSDLCPAYAESIKVSMKNPWTLRVEVVEKTIVAGVEFPEMYAYFDKDGIVVKESELPLEEVSLVEGLAVSTGELFQVLTVEDAAVFENLLEVTMLLNKNEIVPDRILCSGGDDIRIVVGNIEITLGDKDYENKIIQINPILEKLGDEIGILHLENFTKTSKTISFERKKSENN